jgi:chorismate synthase
MAGNTFGKLLTITTFGESHGPALGVTLDGVPSGLPINEKDIQLELDRRRPGQSKVTTPRNEADKVEILSGIFEEKTTGAPICLLIRNANQKSKDYSHIKDLYRPGHADYTFEKKYGFRDYRGGGRSSGRETAARVAAGAIAKKWLLTKGIKIISYTQEVYGVKAKEIDLSEIEKNIIRCPDKNQAVKMIELIEEAKKEGDSLGGVVETLIEGCPVGLGDPVFDKIDATLSHAMMSIGTIKGIEFGKGFEVASMKGSENNDEFILKNKSISTDTNHAGGILGGITSGEPINFRVAVKPPSSITKTQKTVTKESEETSLSVKGRHDPCICPRVVPVVEAMTALTIADAFLIQETLKHNTLI